MLQCRNIVLLIIVFFDVENLTTLTPMTIFSCTLSFTIIGLIFSYFALKYITNFYDTSLTDRKQAPLPFKSIFVSSVLHVHSEQ